MAISDPAHEKLLHDAETLTVPAPISSSFCVPYGTQFQILTKLLTWTDGAYKVEDPKGNLVFKFDKYSFICSNLVVYDSEGQALVSLKRKIFTFHDTWNAYRGKKTHKPENLLFTMERSSVFQWKPSFRIWVAGKEGNEFTLSGDFWRNHYKIRHNGVVIAEAEQKRKFLLDKELAVTVSAGVDQAFIAAILVIQRQIACQHQNGQSGGGP